jgi:hypothetical protein
MNTQTQRARKPVESYCQIGRHGVVNHWVGACAVCDRTFCTQHQGNPQTGAGLYVACPEHVEEVEAMNRAWVARLVRLGLLSFDEEEEEAQ